MNRDDPLGGPLSDAMAFLTSEPVDEQAGWTEVRRRLAVSETSPHRRLHQRRWKGIVAAVLVALGLGGAGVGVATRYVEHTDDGTDLEQLFAGSNGNHQWQVTVEASEGPGEEPGNYCVFTQQGAGGGGICGSDWAYGRRAPLSFSGPLRGLRVDGHPGMLLVVIAEPSKTVAIASSVAGRHSLTDLEGLPGVEKTRAVVKGREFVVYAAAVSNQFSRSSPTESHYPVYR